LKFHISKRCGGVVLRKKIFMESEEGNTENRTCTRTMKTCYTSSSTSEAVCQAPEAVEKETRAATKTSMPAEYVICPFPACEKRIKGNYNLIVHSRKHTDEKPYLCAFPDCNLSFKWRSGLQNHRRKHPMVEIQTKPKVGSPLFRGGQKNIPVVPSEITQNKTFDTLPAKASAHARMDSVRIPKVITKTHKDRKARSMVNSNQKGTSGVPITSISDSAESLINILFETVEQDALLRTGTIPPVQPTALSRGVDIQFERNLQNVLSEHDFSFARRCKFDRLMTCDYVGSQSIPGGGNGTNSQIDTVWPMNMCIDWEALGWNSDISKKLMPENSEYLVTPPFNRAGNAKVDLNALGGHRKVENVTQANILPYALPPEFEAALEMYDKIQINSFISNSI
jgi:hypothetical protein